MKNKVGNLAIFWITNSMFKGYPHKSFYQLLHVCIDQILPKDRPVKCNSNMAAFIPICTHPIVLKYILIMVQGWV